MPKRNHENTTACGANILNTTKLLLIWYCAPTRNSWKLVESASRVSHSHRMWQSLKLFLFCLVRFHLLYACPMHSMPSSKSESIACSKSIIIDAKYVHRGNFMKNSIEQPSLSVFLCPNRGTFSPEEVDGSACAITYLSHVMIYYW